MSESNNVQAQTGTEPAELELQELESMELPAGGPRAASSSASRSPSSPPPDPDSPAREHIPENPYERKQNHAEQQPAEHRARTAGARGDERPRFLGGVSIGVTIVSTIVAAT